MSLSWEQMSRKEQLAASHYDFYKSVHGIRPRWINYDDCSEEELELMMDQLSAENDIVVAQEAEKERKAIDAFEVRVMDLINCLGAKDRNQAIGWIKQSENAEQEDDDYLCYLLGLPYGYFEKECI